MRRTQRAITLEIAREKQARRVVKSKSMVTEELHLNHVLESDRRGSDRDRLGRIYHSAGREPPSHIIIPAIHKNQHQIADLLSEEAGEKLEAGHASACRICSQEAARAVPRGRYRHDRLQLRDCREGSMVMFENEGNARMVQHASEDANYANGHGADHPVLEDLEVMATLLPRSATGQKLTVYMSAITGPKRTARRRMGRRRCISSSLITVVRRQLGDPEFQELLNCIRCGACLNVCPVYRHIGGHAYGSIYSGPIGAVLTPALQEDLAQWDDIADASSLCGAC